MATTIIQTQNRARALEIERKGKLGNSKLKTLDNQRILKINGFKISKGKKMSGTP